MLFVSIYSISPEQVRGIVLGLSRGGGGGGTATPALAPPPKVSRVGNLRQCQRCPDFSYDHREPELFRAHCQGEWHVNNLRRENESRVPLSHGDYLAQLVAQEDGGEIDDSALDVVSEEGEGEVALDQCDDVSPPAPSSDWSLVIPPRFSTPWLNHSALGVAVCQCWVNSASIKNETDPLIRSRYTSDCVKGFFVDILIDKYFVIVLLVRSGRFAGAVFQQGKVLQHTSFKFYTTRAKSGKAQSTHDNQSSGSTKSVGSQIRRGQEKKFNEEIVGLISEKWKEYFCQGRFRCCLYVPKAAEFVLFDKAGPFAQGWRTDNLHRVPLVVNRPSFAEVVKVHDTVMQVSLGESLSS
jgi:hypothetical protein